MFYASWDWHVRTSWMQACHNSLVIFLSQLGEFEKNKVPQRSKKAEETNHFSLAAPLPFAVDHYRQLELSLPVTLTLCISQNRDSLVKSDNSGLNIIPHCIFFFFLLPVTCIPKMNACEDFIWTGIWLINLMTRARAAKKWETCEFFYPPTALNTQHTVSCSPRNYLTQPYCALDILQNKLMTWWSKQNKRQFLGAKPLGPSVWNCWNCWKTALTKPAIKRKRGPLQSVGKDLQPAEVV